MFERLLLTQLHAWAAKDHRKPLVLRGARQVGKTTIVNMFSKEFDQYIHLNLELASEKQMFDNNYSIDELVTAIFFYKDKPKETGKTLLFIDEIQNSQEAVSSLRYFYEEVKDLYVIAAGSLLESLIDSRISFPVGRVEYLAVRPCSFPEFLLAQEDNQSLEILENLPLPEFAHDKLLRQFHLYTLIGGMPEIVQQYSDHQDLYRLNTIYESLLAGYLDDVEKYARNKTMNHIIRHTIQQSFFSAGSRIKFQGFGNSNYKSREMGEAFRILEKAMLLQLVYPATGISLPIQPDVKKSPKLQLLDTGLVNFAVGLQKKIFGAKNISEVYQGRIAEHIAGQELLALNYSVLHKLQFWTREKKHSNAELDFIYSFGDMLIPMEVKTGATGRLRSLHQFIDRALYPFAVRVYAGKLSIEKAETISHKKFYLLNLPFYLVHKLPDYIKWFINNV